MELVQFLKTVLYMACVFFPNSRLHLSKFHHNNNVADLMPRDRLEEMKRNIHFGDSLLQPAREDNNFDRMCLKSGIVVENLQKKVQRTPKMSLCG